MVCNFNTPTEATELAKKLQKETGTQYFVIKAQIHAGGRGKGGGVKLAKSIDEVYKLSNEILGMNLVTPLRLQNREKSLSGFNCRGCILRRRFKIEEFLYQYF